MPWAILIPAIIGAATTVGTTAYAQSQNNKAARRATDREREAALLQSEAAERAYQFGKEELNYDRWRTSALGKARQPYLDMAMNMGSGATYDPGHYAPAEPFAAPTRDAARNEEGYRMVEEEGNRALEGRGGLDPASLQALQGYGAQRATGQYDKVYDRARNAYAMREALRGQAFDRTAGAGFQAAGLHNQGLSTRLGNTLSIAQLTGAGEYPAYVADPNDRLYPAPRRAV